MEIYVAKGGQRTGPYSREQLMAMLTSGAVGADDLGWHSGIPEWLPLSRLLALGTPGSAMPPLPPPRDQGLGSRQGLTAEDYRDEKELRWFWICLAVSALPIMGLTTFSVGTFLVVFAIVVGLAVLSAKWRLNQLLGHCIHVSERQLPEVHAAAQAAATDLGMIPPKFFVQHDEALNAFASGLLGNDCVVLTSGLVETLSPKELNAVLGHELSHIKCGHTKWAALTGTTGPAQATLPAKAFSLIFKAWSRRAEYTCDRGALLASRDLEATASALIELATGKHLFNKINLSEFLAQRTERNKHDFAGMAEVFSTHPSIVDRIHALRDYANSPAYAKLCERNPDHAATRLAKQNWVVHPPTGAHA